MKNFWESLFLVERPSIGLAFFRFFVAIALGFHLIPTFFPLRENYLNGSFRVLDDNFFPQTFLDWVGQSPDSFIVFMAAVFCVAWFFFLIGLWTRISCLLMTAGCYYFYALNSFPMGTLSWDILLVTLILLCVTDYQGDYFSVDAVLRGDTAAYSRVRPFFIQRLLQIQIAFIYFYTGLYKITGSGNWLSDNPLYWVMLYPEEGVTKYFLLRDFLASHPEWCYVIGVLIVFVELLMPFLLFNRSTRYSAIYLGFIFHLILLLTLDVPAIFFFLFPAQLLLFISPEEIILWVNRRRKNLQGVPPLKVIYDGNCQFCNYCVRMLSVMDLWGRLVLVNYHVAGDLAAVHRDLTLSKAHSQMALIDESGQLFQGFFAFRRLAWSLPMMYILIPVLYLPGMNILGPLVYALIARNRYMFHFNKKCANNACLR